MTIVEVNRYFASSSTIVISAREEKDFGELLEDKDWNVIEVDAGQRIWTDDYSNVVGAIVRNLRKHHAFTPEE